MERRIRSIGFATLTLATLAMVLSLDSLGQATSQQSNRKPPSKRPPKQWDRRILDVFFDDIHKAVGPGQPGSGGPREMASGGNPATGSAGATDAAATPGGFAWSTEVSAETLEDEIKQITLGLEETVENPGRFKSGRHNDARRMFSVAAVMFDVIAEYDKDIRFKDKAAGLRDGMAKAGVNCKVNTDAAYSEARNKFEQLQEIVRGANLDIPQPAELLPKSEVAEFGPVMQRIEGGFLQKVKPGIADNSAFQGGKEDLLHEAEMLTIFARFIRDESFGYADDERFKQQSEALETQAQALVAALRANDLTAAQTAVAGIDQSCTKCHADFR